jgi:anti-sigma-K factor RskA
MGFVGVNGVTVRKVNGGASPCRTLSAAERAEIEKRLRAEGRLRAATKAELEKLSKLRAWRQEQMKGWRISSASPSCRSCWVSEIVAQTPQ